MCTTLAIQADHTVLEIIFGNCQDTLSEHTLCSCIFKQKKRGGGGAQPRFELGYVYSQKTHINTTPLKINFRVIIDVLVVRTICLHSTCIYLDKHENWSEKVMSNV